MGANFTLTNWQFPPNNVELNRRVQNINIFNCRQNNKLKAE